MKWIIHASFTIAALLPEVHSEKAKKFFISLSDDDELIVPGIWWYEICNVLSLSEIRKVTDSDKTEKAFALLSSMQLRTDFHQNIQSIKEIYKISNENNLSSYDASYIETAKRHNGGLATFDNSLRSAAKKELIHLYKI